MTVPDRLHESTVWARKKSAPVSLLHNFFLMATGGAVALVQRKKNSLKAFDGK